MRDKRFDPYLLATTLTGAALLGGATPALAQDASAQPDAAAASDAQAGEGAAVPVTNVNEGSAGEEIVVTGTLFRRTNAETPSPVTVLSAEALERRGITNIADAVRSVSADNSGSVPTAFTNGFGQGAAGVALRGLTVNSTLTVIDGLRMVTYPLADDGQRNFVDLNTIPRVAIERIEVLKDGASSTYGADAIGGVVNVIMRRQFTGLEATAEAGVSQRGDGESYRGSVLGGVGDISTQGWNLYVGAEYEFNGDILARDRGFPYNTGDLTSIGGDNNNSNLQIGGGAPTVATVRPATQNIPGNPLSGVAVPGGHFQLLNPAECIAEGGTIYNGALGQTCEQNLVAMYGRIQPEHTRYGFTARGSVSLGGDSEAYLMGSYYRSHVRTPGAPPSPRSSNPVRTLELVLPAHLANGQLNPNNPYAAQGLAAQLFYRFDEIESFGETDSEVLRGALGVSGSFGEGWTYSFEASAANSELELTQGGVLHLPSLIQAINTGSYNFVHPELNDPALSSQLGRTISTHSTSNLYLAQGVVTRELFTLPGGPLQLAVGGQIRREELDQPNANPTNEYVNVNQYSAQGQRTVSAAFFEVSAPVVDELELQLSGRYDSYSTGFDSFSPKIGFKFTPIPQLAVRGTFSRGFRAPSIAESGEGGVMGFSGFNPGNAFENVCEAHGGTYSSSGCSGGSPYVGTQSIGSLIAANPDLGPEHSRSFTLGAVFQPTRWLSFTADYYNIRKTNVITGAPLINDAIAAYYGGEDLPEGYAVVLNAPDPQFPNAIRTISYVSGPYANASSLRTSGIDLAALAQFPLRDGLRFSSQIEVTHIFGFSFIPAEGEEPQEYAGTQGPYFLSSGAGTPSWRGSWSNSLEMGPATLTATAYYTSGYMNVAEDVSGAGASESCEAAGDLYSPDFCRTKSFINVDLVGSYRVNDNFSLYANVLNLFDARAPLNASNYAGNNYNPTWSQQGAVGRYFRVGANIRF